MAEATLAATKASLRNALVIFNFIKHQRQ